VDTRNSTLGSSVAYSPSQLDTGDVDPVAEADVYLAYGRDLQAEEILKESLKNHPDRNAARLKLLEIYAKRKDVRSFEMTAAELFALTEGVGEDWKKAQDLGRHLDPINPLYHNTVPPSTIGAPSTIPASDFAPTGSSMLSAPMTLPATELLTSLPSLMKAAPAAVEPAGSGLDLDLNLSGPPAAPLKAVAPTPYPRSEPVSAAVEKPVVSDKSEEPLNFDFSGFHAPDSTLPVNDEPAHLSGKQPLEFDLGALSLDLPSSADKADAPSLATAATPAKSVPSAGDDLHFATHDSPLTEPLLDSSHGLDTRLALVEECRAMGDVDMARNLLGEIIAESEGATKARAERMLAELR
jgi:pilus assembly protein FimV